MLFRLTPQGASDSAESRYAQEHLVYFVHSLFSCALQVNSLKGVIKVNRSYRNAMTGESAPQCRSAVCAPGLTGSQQPEGFSYTARSSPTLELGREGRGLPCPSLHVDSAPDTPEARPVSPPHSHSAPPQARKPLSWLWHSWVSPPVSLSGHTLMGQGGFTVNVC